LDLCRTGSQHDVAKKRNLGMAPGGPVRRADGRDLKVEKLRSLTDRFRQLDRPLQPLAKASDDLASAIVIMED
jgi:hypothetical protein